MEINSNDSGKKSSHLNFISSFWESCADLSFYSKALKASLAHIIFHGLCLIIIMSISYSAIFYNSFLKNFSEIFKGTPSFIIKDGKAEFPDDLKLPFTKEIPTESKRKLFYIVDKNPNRQIIKNNYDAYILFTENEMVMNDGKKEIDFQYKQKNSPRKAEPIEVNPKTLAEIVAISSVFILFLFFLPFCILFFFPMLIFSSASVVMTFDKWTVSFSEILKLAVFAATPACLIQLLTCFFLENNLTLLSFFLVTSWFVQVAYLSTGLKANKELTQNQA